MPTRNPRPAFVPTLVALAFTLALGACGGQRTAAPAATGVDSDLGTLVLALATVPSDVRCVRVVVTGNQTVTRTFDVSPGAAAHLTLGGLPIGMATLYEETFDAACSALDANTPATWVATARVPVTLAPGQTTVAMMVLARPGNLDVTNDFQGGLLVLDPLHWDFENTLVGAGQNAVYMAWVRNNSPVPFVVDAHLGGANPGDTVIAGSDCPAPPAALAAGAKCYFQLSFVPTAAGVRTGLFSLTGGPTMTTQGTGLDSLITLSPLTDAFGTVTVGTQSPAHNFTVTNTAGAPYDVLPRTTSPDFVVTGSSCLMALTAGSSCTVNVAFAPASEGAQTGNLAIGPLAPSASLTGSGTGHVDMSPTSHDFGPVAVGGQSGPMRFDLLNTTGVPFPLAIGTGSPEFLITGGDCMGALPPLGHCSVNLTFKPVSAGPRNALLSTGAGGPVAMLVGLGIGGGPLVLTPTSHDFGPVAIGSQSPRRQFLLHNGTGMPFPFSASTGSPEFVLMGSCGVVQPNADCVFAVAFVPNSPGAKNTVLVVGSSGQGLSAMLAGTGLGGGPLTLNPTSRDFGGVVAGAQSSPTAFTVQNGTGMPFDVMPSVNAPDFIVSAPMCHVLQPGQSCTVTVIFAPAAGAASGPRNAVLGIGAGGPSAMLMGQVVGGVVTLTPATDSFGNALSGTQGAAHVFTVHNGTATAFTVAPTVGGDFVITANACSGALAPGASCTLGIAFRPLSAGAKSAPLGTGAGGPTATLSGSAWTSADIGSVGKTGSAAIANGTFTVNGAGADVYKTADAFKYVFQSVTGNATVTAHVASVQAADVWTKAGLMMRVGTTADAVNVFALTTPTVNNGYRTQVRTTQGGSTSSPTGPLGNAPVWLRLVRNGSTFTTSVSTDGLMWTQTNVATVTMPGTINVGLAMCSHVASTPTLAAGVFDNVTVTQP